MGVYAPLAAWLIEQGRVDLALGGAALVAWLTMIPDLDHQLPRISHRGPTHSLAFALAVGAALGLATDFFVVAAFGDLAAGAWIVAPGFESALASFVFALAALTIVGHLLADVITPMGVRPFWPISDRSYTLRITTARNRAANYLLLAGGTFAATTAVLYSL